MPRPMSCETLLNIYILYKVNTDKINLIDNILNNTKYTTKDFTTSTNLKITEKDKGYLEAYLEGQINKLEEARVGIKAGVKW